MQPFETSLSHLVAVISSITHLPSSEIRLVYQGILLDDLNRTLTSYRIQDGASIDLIGAPSIDPSSTGPSISRSSSHPRDDFDSTHSEGLSEHAMAREIELFVIENLDPLQVPFATLISILESPWTDRSDPLHSHNHVREEYLRLGEAVMRVMLNLDGREIPPGWDNARKQRKEGVRLVQQMLDQLDKVWDVSNGQGSNRPLPRSPSLISTTSAAELPPDREGAHTVHSETETTSETTLVRHILSLVSSVLTPLEPPVTLFLSRASMRPTAYPSGISPDDRPLEKEHTRLHELVVRGLIALDGVEIPAGYSEARKQRKEGIKHIQAMLNEVDEVWLRRKSQYAPPSPTPSSLSSFSQASSTRSDQPRPQPDSEAVTIHQILSTVKNLSAQLDSPIAIFVTKGAVHRATRPEDLPTYTILQQEHATLSKSVLGGLLELNELVIPAEWSDARKHRKDGVRAIQRYLIELGEI